ncbi:MAG TPA: hypothetical protein GXZ30_12765 [Propionibacterium sp.]|jgi:hypothetical protein|nr:hypothetical protein [Propionibacterium sp.]
MAAAKLRIGLLNDDTWLAPEIAELVRWARRRDDMEVSHLLLHPAPRDPDAGRLDPIKRIVRKHGVLGTASRVSFRVLTLLESRALKAQGLAAQDVDLTGDIPHQLVFSPQVSGSGYVYRFPDEDIAAIRDAGIDVLIRCGTGILKGDILTATPFGILSFHHGDNRVNRGGPPGFWEVQKRWPSTGFVIQQLTEELDGGHVLARGNYPTERYFAANRRNIVQRSAPHLKEVLSRLAQERTLPEPLPATPYSGPLLRTPGLADQLRYAARQTRLVAVRGGRRLLGLRSDWAVAYVRRDWRNAVLRRGRELPAPPGTFLADPFVIERNGAHFCFVEEYSYTENKAVISVFMLGDKDAERVGVALDEPFHLSFPALFEHSGELYMCPETLGANDIRFYRCTDFPLGWELAGTAIDNIQACDTLVFPHAGKWWLLTTVDQARTGTPTAELWAFSADSPFSDWEPHPMNPLRNDTDSARNAGLLRDGEELFRVTQRHGFAHYGAAATIRRIRHLGAEGLIEEEIAEITPDFRPDIHGAHHLHSDGKVTVFDFVRHRRPR